MICTTEIIQVAYQNKLYFFTTIKGIFDKFTSKQLGIKKTSLWNYKLRIDNHYQNKFCKIEIVLLHYNKRI